MSVKIGSLFLWVTILIQHYPSSTQARIIYTATAATTATMAPQLQDPTNVNGDKACPSVDLLDNLRKKYPHQPTFLQAVEEMALSLQPLFSDPVQGEFYQRAFLAMAEPERTISFRVPWEDDSGVLHFNRGWRVEFSRYVH
jgi:hypothetical protein